MPTRPTEQRKRARQKPGAGYVERLAYHFMARILEAGWTEERARMFFGGMSEEQMRRAVAYARRCGFLK